MSQKQFLAEFDADLHAAFADVDMADAGTYTALAGGEPVPCRCYVDKGLQSAGEYAPTFGARIVVSILRADVASPRVNGIVCVDGETFKLASPEDEDDGVSRWVVTPHV